MKFAGSATGTAFLICPVSVFTYTSGCGMALGVTASDPDGAGGTHFVRSWLNALPITTGSVASLTAVTSAHIAKNLDSTSFSHVFDFDTNYYYVVIEMHRGSTASNPLFYGTLLQDPITCII